MCFRSIIWTERTSHAKRAIEGIYICDETGDTAGAPGGTPYIVAKAGFLLQAVIMPYDVISQQFVDNLKRLTEQCVLSLDLREREKALARAAEPEQYSLNVDPATGEIVEEGKEAEE